MDPHYWAGEAKISLWNFTTSHSFFKIKVFLGHLKGATTIDSVHTLCCLLLAYVVRVSFLSRYPIDITKVSRVKRWIFELSHILATHETPENLKPGLDKIYEVGSLSNNDGHGYQNVA